MGKHKDERDIKSLREWLASWGDGTHWADPMGETVPISKATLAELLDEIERLRGGIRELHERVLSGNSTAMHPMMRANLATYIDGILNPTTGDA